MKPERFVPTDLIWCNLLLLAGCTLGAPTGRAPTMAAPSVRAPTVRVGSTRITSARTVTVRTATLTGDGSARPETAKPTAAFVREQLRFSRVRDARAASEEAVEQMFRERGIGYPAAEMYLRVFKKERVLELWVRPADSNRFEMLRAYPICALAGVLGPKQKEGDRQVPEGFYSIDLFNPASSYYLSLRINYPNQRDRAATGTQRRLGGDIYIHGGCKSDGCLAITDEAIRELYWIAVMARGWGQAEIPVHIFPARLDHGVRKIKRTYHDESLLEFWESLRPGYDYFQKERQLPRIGVDAGGRYHINRSLVSTL